MEIIALDPSTRPWATSLLEAQWGSARIVSRGRVHDASALEGFVALHEGEPAGLATYRIEGGECELTTLNSLVEEKGIASALVEAVKDRARTSACARLWLITTNDNLKALGFYQKRGFSLVGLHRGAIEYSRKLKPEIPGIGIDGIPIRDELELEILLC